tara:strand:- start:159 stop:524 length:366 start_codon:yes stop_codon:yes gene_type:complete
MIPKKADAISALVSGPITAATDGSYVVYHDGQTPPTEEEINAKFQELKTAYPMKLLREERDRRLAETDWWCCSDLTPTQAQLDYRTALRDLPQNFSPIIDIITEDGYPIVKEQTDWPEKPS